MSRILLQISILLLIVSCKSFVPENAELIANSGDVFENNYFSDPQKDYVYRASIEAYDNHFGGIFIVKKMEDNLHRVVLTTDIGFKLLDAEVSQTTFKINSIAKEFDKKQLIDLLKKDLKLLFKEKFEVTATYSSPSAKIHKSADEKNYWFLFENKKTKRLDRIVHSSRTKEKVSFRFVAKNNTFADAITITHKKFDIRIELRSY